MSGYSLKAHTTTQAKDPAARQECASTRVYRTINFPFSIYYAELI